MCFTEEVDRTLHFHAKMVIPNAQPLGILAQSGTSSLVPNTEEISLPGSSQDPKPGQANTQRGAWGKADFTSAEGWGAQAQAGAEDSTESGLMGLSTEEREKEGVTEKEEEGRGPGLAGGAAGGGLGEECNQEKRTASKKAAWKKQF